MHKTCNTFVEGHCGCGISHLNLRTLMGFLNGPFTASFFFIFVFSRQLTINVQYKYNSDDWIRTADLWCLKWPLYQLSHNHCPTLMLINCFQNYCADSHHFVSTTDLVCRRGRISQAWRGIGPLLRRLCRFDGKSGQHNRRCTSCYNSLHQGPRICPGKNAIDCMLCVLPFLRLRNNANKNESL